MKQNRKQVKKVKEIKRKAYDASYELALIIIFGIFLVLFTTNKLTSEDDYYWHLATGRYIVSTGIVPSSDPFSFSTEGQHWFATEWGWDVFTYYIFQSAGPAGLSVLTTLIFLTIYGLFYIVLKKFRVSNSFIIFFFLILSFGVFERITPRPHIISYLFFAFIIYSFVTYKFFNRKTKLIYFLPPVFLLWANMHMGVLFGLVLLALFVIAELIIYFKPKDFQPEPLTKNEIIKAAVITVICGLVMLINPHGILTYSYALSSHVNTTMLKEAVLEWHSPFNPRSFGKFHNISYIFFLVSAISVFIYYRKRKDITALLIVTVFALNSLRALRFTVDYLLIGFVFIVLSLSYLLEKPEEKTHVSVFSKLPFKMSLSVFLLVLIITIPANKLYHSYLEYPRFFGFGIDKNYFPENMMQFIKDNNIHNIGQRPFNTFEIGGYFLWNFPDKKNFFDGRDLNDFIMNEYQVIYSKIPGFEKKIDEWNFDYAVIAVPDIVSEPQIMKQTVISHFATSPEWKLVWWSDRAMLFVKDIPAFSEIINKYAFNYINAYNFSFRRNVIDKAVSDNKEAVKNEIIRKMNEEPEGFVINTINRNYWGKVK